jgi:Zn-dependent protease with chaperone function
MIYRKILLLILLLILSCAPLAFARDAGAYVTLKGVKIDFNDPFKLEFIVDYGRGGKLDPAQAKLLVNYFLAALAMPEDKMWVNLSPYEPDRVIEPDLSQTEFGEGLLSQDCALKQFAASLTNPETESGKRYWDAIQGRDTINNSGPSTRLHSLRVSSATSSRGASAPARSSFTKIWIVPRSAKIYQSEDTALIESRALSVMTQEDYLAMNKNGVGVGSKPTRDNGQVTNLPLQKSNINAFKTTILPSIEQEVNSGERFVPLRQMYDAFILASWFKKRLQDSLFRYYLDQGKVNGIDLADKNAKEKIYQQYVRSFSGGEYNIIKKDYNRYSGKITARKYVSGGISLTGANGPFADTTLTALPMPADQKATPGLAVTLAPVNSEPEFILNDKGTLTLSHNDINKAIFGGLSNKIKRLSIEGIKARYRDKESKVIILPVHGLLRKTGLAAHIGLGSYYNEPVVYIDDTFMGFWQRKSCAKIAHHELYEINKWEAKRKELGLSYQEMRQWIQKNSNRQGTGLAQQLARQWHDEANAINDSSIEGITDYDQSSFAYRRQAQGRVDRCLNCILATMRHNAGKAKDILSVGELSEIFNITLTERGKMPLASVGRKNSISMRYELVDALTDEELMYVIGHEVGHRLIESWQKKIGEMTLSQHFAEASMMKAMERFAKALREENQPYYHQLEQVAQKEESLADQLGIFLALKAGSRPDTAENAFRKRDILVQRLGKLGKYKYQEDSPLADLALHPDDALRVAAMNKFRDDLGIEDPGTLYEKDVVLAAAPDGKKPHGTKGDLGGVDFGYHVSHVVTPSGKLSDKDFPVITAGLKNSRGLYIKGLLIQSKP